MTFGPGAGAGVGVSIPNPLAILNGGVGVGASLPGIGAGVSLGGGGAGAGANVGGNGGAGVGANVGGGGGGDWGANGGSGAGAGVGVNGGVGANGGASGEQGAGLGVNGGVGANGGAAGEQGSGAGVNGQAGLGASGQGQGQGESGGNWGASGEQSGQQGAGVGGSAGGSGEANQGAGVGAGVGAGIGANGANGGVVGGSSGQAGGSAETSPEASTGVNGNAGVGGAAPEASAGLGASGNSGAGSSGSSESGNSGAAGIGAGIGAGAGLGGQVGGQAGLQLQPLPGVQAGAAAGGSGSPCTVMGGQARLLYFPPGGNGGSGSEQSSPVGAQPPGSTITTAPGAPAAQGQPVPAGGTPLTAWSNTFNPDYCYLSVNTLYATVAPSGTESAQTVGPTFSNAIFPLRSSDISTRCPSTMSGYATNTAGVGAPGQLDFNSMAAAGEAGADNCHQIVAPAAMGSIVPEWNNGLFWNMNFEPPQVLRSEGAAASPTAPAAGGECQACAAPAYSPPIGQNPTMVPAPGYQGVASGPTTAPAGVSPSSFGQYTQTAPATTGGAVGGYAPAPSAGFGTYAPNGTSPVSPTTGGPSQPAPYTGNAVSMLALCGGRGTPLLVAGLLMTLMWL